jgi:hypothetical protein
LENSPLDVISETDEQVVESHQRGATAVFEDRWISWN